MRNKTIIWTIVFLALGGYVYASFLYPQQGGTGTSTIPTYGQVFVGNSSGTYTLTATSSLGVSAASSTLLSDVNTFSKANTFSTTTIQGYFNTGILNATTSAYLGSLTLGTKLANAQLANSTIIVNGTTLTLGDLADTLNAASSTHLSDVNKFSNANFFSTTTIQGYLNTGIVTATSSITTNNLTVNGTCTGCPLGNPNLTYLTITSTKYYTASTSATDNLVWDFNNGFVSKASSTFNGNIFATSLSVGTTSVQAPVVIRGHIQTGATSTPILTACGTNPTIIGNDMVGRLVIGSGVISSCTVNFTTSWTNIPVCFADDETAILLVRTVATNATVVITTAATFNGDTVDYHCIGFE